MNDPHLACDSAPLGELFVGPREEATAGDSAVGLLSEPLASSSLFFEPNIHDLILSYYLLRRR